MINNVNPYISVMIITYNHERYISKAIESVLRQETSHSLEIVVSDDCSTDATRQIVWDYYKAHPQIIRYLFRPRNLGFQKNFIETLKSCRGRYVAVLDGDDYWVPPDKITNQIELLEANPDCILCFGRAMEFHEDDRSVTRVVPCLNGQKFSLNDLLKVDPIPTCTAVFRYDRMLEIPAWVEDMPMVDWVLWVLLAQNGSMIYLPKILGAYRKHSQGVWTSKSREEQIRSDEIFYHKMKDFLPEEYNATIEKGLRRLAVAKSKIVA